MAPLTEHKSAYQSADQRAVLLELMGHPAIEEHFFLTGGTALAVFYLGHRVSNDIDLFCRHQLDLTPITFWISGKWTSYSMPVKQTPQFASYVIRNVKVDLVLDPLSNDQVRERHKFENGKSLAIDNIRNISSNKLCTIVSRIEPKDFIDLFCLMKNDPALNWDTVYSDARNKDAIFDDPPTAAFQIEQGWRQIQADTSLFPKLTGEIDPQNLDSFYRHLINWIYSKAK
jgi:hypothetical protein